MKALTIRQPYAHLILNGEKRVENRVWPTPYRGDLYLHAGKSRDWLTDDNYGIPESRMAFGAVVGVMKLIDCLPIAEIIRGDHDKKYPWLRTHEHTSGPWCWIIDMVTPIGPWPWKGAQRLFDIDSIELDKVANRELGIAMPGDPPPTEPEIRLFRPSNATHGDCFMAGFCYKCAKWPEDPDAKKQCGIFLRTQFYDTDDKEFPREWRYGEEGDPVCTAFKDREEFNAERRAKPRPRRDKKTIDLFSCHSTIQR